MRHLIVGVLFVLAQSSALVAGDYGCNASFARYYQTPVYSQAVYSAPVYSAPTCAAAPCYGCAQQSYAQTAYQVAPDLAQARLIQEATAQAIAQYQAKIEAAQARQADVDFKNQVLQLLQQQRQPATVAYDPEKEQLRQTVQQLQAVIQQMQQPQPPPPAAIPPAKSPVPPAGVPHASANPNMGDALAVVQKAFADSCMPCHAEGKKDRLVLTDASRLSKVQLMEIEHRLISNDPDVFMPKGKKPVDIAVVNAVHRMVNVAK